MDTSKHSGYKDFMWAVELSRLGLELVGLWPKYDEVAKNNFTSDLRVGVVFITINFLSLIPLVCSLIRIWGDMILMIDNLEVTLTLLAVSLKLVVMRWKRTVVSAILRMMLEDWMELNVDTQRSIMVKRAQTSRLITICGCILMAVGLAVLLVLPPLGLPFRHFSNLTDRNRMLPLQTYYFYDTDKSPQFELTFMVQAVTMFFAAVIYTSVNAFLGLCIFHICGQLENFRRQLIGWTLCKDFESSLRKNVEAHRRLIRFTQNIEDTFSVLMLGLLFYFGTAFCLFAFLLLAVVTGNETSDVSFARKCLGLLGGFTLFAHTFLYCGAGEIIIEHCEAIYRAIYDLRWYNLETRKARSLMLLMIRAKEPSRVTAGRVLPLTMATFCSLLKTTAGYISFLLAIRN